MKQYNFPVTFRNKHGTNTLVFKTREGVGVWKSGRVSSSNFARWEIIAEGDKDWELIESAEVAVRETYMNISNTKTIRLTAAAEGGKAWLDIGGSLLCLSPETLEDLAEDMLKIARS